MIDVAKMLALRTVLNEADELWRAGSLTREQFEAFLTRANEIFPDRPDLVEPIFYFARAEWGGFGALSLPKNPDRSD